MKNQNAPYNRNARRREPEHKINEMIKHPVVRVTGVDPNTGEKIDSQVLNINEARRMADQMGVDLVEISPNADPPVCRIVDYKKFLYEQKQRKKTQEQNSKQAELKELRLTPQTDTHDLEFKARHAKEWLGAGHKVKCSVFFKGRSIVYKEQGELVLLNLATMLEEVGKPEGLPKMEGKRMFMTILPKKK